jgi:hypothetical protein
VLRLQLRLLGERLGDDALHRGMGADVGDGVEPISQLSIETVRAAETASEEDRPRNVALGFRAVRPAGMGWKR